MIEQLGPASAAIPYHCISPIPPPWRWIVNQSHRSTRRPGSACPASTFRLDQIASPTCIPNGYAVPSVTAATSHPTSQSHSPSDAGVISSASGASHLPVHGFGQLFPEKPRRPHPRCTWGKPVPCAEG
jgi:hypothetical protein